MRYAQGNNSSIRLLGCSNRAGSGMQPPLACPSPRGSAVGCEITAEVCETVSETWHGDFAALISGVTAANRASCSSGALIVRSGAKCALFDR